jgi:anti-sigma regulatory factor (Ser/Thr protein kinase)
VTTLRPTGEWDGSSFAHEGFVFGSDSELTDRVVPFIEEGLSRNEPILVVGSERVRQMLLDELGGNADRLAGLAASEQWWQGGHDTIAAFDEYMRAFQASVPSWRLVGEPIWIGDDYGREWSRFESALNVFYADMPCYSLCLHDRQRLSADALDVAARTHPLRWDGSAPMEAVAYEDPAEFIASVAPPWTPRPANASTATVFTVRDARRVVGSALMDGWASRADDITLAVHELVANALREAGVAEVASWASDDMLVIEISDGGRGLTDPLRGYAPPSKNFEGGRGMWLAWNLADDAASMSSPAGTSIRVFFRRD